MSFPVYIPIGGVTVHPHVFFEGLAYIVAIAVLMFARHRSGDVVGTRTRWVLVAAALVGGIAGSRLLSLAEGPFPVESWLASLGSGKTIVGGLVGGVIAVEWMKRRLHVRQPTGDLVTLPLLAGIAIGRVGCFLSGLEDQSYGVATTVPWGVDFGDGIQRHPTQLYEIVFLSALGLLLVWRRDRLTTAGDQFKLFLGAYAAFRVLVDLIKPGVRIGGLSALQWASVAIVAFYWPHLRRIAATLAGRSNSGVSA